jgi:hypothetical protein
MEVARTRGSKNWQLVFAYNYGRQLMCYSYSKETRAKGYAICSTILRHDNELGLGIDFKKKGRVLMWAVDKFDLDTVKCCVTNGTGLKISDYCLRQDVRFKGKYEFWDDVFHVLLTHVSYPWAMTRQKWDMLIYLLERLDAESQERLRELCNQSPLREVGWHLVFLATRSKKQRFVEIMMKHLPEPPYRYKTKPPIKDWNYTSEIRSHLTHAIIYGRPEAVRAILDGGRSPDEKDQWSSIPIILAAQYHKLDLLLEYGPDPNVRDRYGNVVLALVLTERYEYMDQRKPGFWGCYGPVTIGGFWGTDVLHSSRQLIRYGFDYNIRMTYSYIPALELALAMKNRGVVEMLLLAGARPWNKQKSNRAIKRAFKGVPNTFVKQPKASIFLTDEQKAKKERGEPYISEDEWDSGVDDDDDEDDWEDEVEEHIHGGRYQAFTDIHDYLRVEESSELYTLQQMCRFSIRKALNYNIPNKVKQLPLPKPLQTYLNIPELDDLYEFYYVPVKKPRWRWMGGKRYPWFS